jgi:hypothetical protein
MFFDSPAQAAQHPRVIRFHNKTCMLPGVQDITSPHPKLFQAFEWRIIIRLLLD